MPRIDTTRTPDRHPSDLLPRTVRNPTAWVVLVLFVLSFLQRPGLATFDTKLDLVVNPIGFLGRSLDLWNPYATSGELQNQAYGYLFPMGPFFAVGQLLGLPAWITQSLWAAVLLSLAFYGVLRLARALGIGSEPTRYLGAIAYAMAPRVLTEIGPLSAEMLPAVMLPWVLLPLVTADRFRSPRRAAGLSALAVLCMGGVNGAMVVMALVLPGLWLLTRAWDLTHVKLVLWWCGGVIACTLWWILPLLLLGRYSLPFLDYIESAANTTAPMSLFQVLRGTNQWVAYVFQGTPWWPNGWLLIDNPVLMAGTAAVAAIGMVGLCRLSLPERRFLVLGTLVGLTLLTIGYVGSLDSPFAEPVRALLDGPLAPLRNVHKFEPVLRLCLALGFVHGLSVRTPAAKPAISAVWRKRLRMAGAAVLVVVIAAPAWLLTLRPGIGWSEVPDHWSEATSWLAEQDPDARTLLLPATGFGQYTWGRTVDEPMQSLAETPWAVRNQVPLGSEGNTRVMDAIDEAVASGRGSAGLADFLARSGFRFLLLRNDIERTAVDAPPLAVLREGLAGSPGIERVAEFGPEVAMRDQRLISSVDQDVRGRALEIYEVKRTVPRVTVTAAKDVATVSGGPESLLPLLSQGLLAGDRPTVFAGDRTGQVEGGWIVTDGLRRRERNVGRVSDNLSQTMTAEESGRQGRTALDVTPFPEIGHHTVAEYRGIRGVRASTATSYADAAGSIDPANSPFAAVDGDPNSAWHSSSFVGPVGQWLEVELDTPRELSEVGLTILNDLRVGWPVTKVQITTEAGSRDHEVPEAGGPTTYAVAKGLTSTVRVTVLEMSAERQDGNVGIQELVVPGTTAQRALRVPSDATSATLPTFSFSRGDEFRPACYPAGPTVRCDAGISRFGEEPAGLSRLFRTASDGRFQVSATVLAAAGAVNPVQPPNLNVTATSTLAGDAAASALAAVDGNPATAWTPDITDLRPELRLRLPGPRTFTELHLDTVPSSYRPVELALRTPAQTVVVRVNGQGKAVFDPITTDSLDIVVRETGPPADDDTGSVTPGPGAIAELTIPGLEDLFTPVPPETPFTVPCGRGPLIQIDNNKINTSVTGTLGDITGHRPLKAIMCDDDLSEALEVRAGDHDLRTTRSDTFVVQEAWLRPLGDPAVAPVHRDVRVDRWDATHREVRVGAGEAAVLRVPENANEGWVATLDGTPLARTRVDGWQQAWELPKGGEGVVRLDFEPDTQYKGGLLIGGLTALTMLGVVAVPVGRRRAVVASVRATTGRWPLVAMVVVLFVLGGMPPVVALITSLLLRQFWQAAPKVIALCGMVAGCVVAVTGRLLGHSQEWAYGPLVQGALLVAVAALVAACFKPFAPSGR